MQFSLRSLLLIAPVIALGLFALKQPSLLVLQLIFTSTLLALLSSLTISMFGQPHYRPFAFGFGLFGIGYFAIVALVGEFNSSEIDDTPLLTSRFLQILYVPFTNPVAPPAGMGGGGGRYALFDPPEHLFRRVGHTVFTLIMALVGGMFTNLVHRISSARVKAAEHIKDTASLF